jgi:LPXTG-motif cell wall-anchored protein
VAGIGLSWAAMIAGLGLLVRRRRQRTARGDAGA